MACVKISVEKNQQLPFEPFRVWEILSDTDHLNRFLKLPRVQYDRPVQTDKALYRIAVAKPFPGLRVEWKEYPFEWVRGRSYSVLREYSQGPIQTMQLEVDAVPIPDGTDLHVRINAAIRWGWLKYPLEWIAQYMLGRILAYAQATVQNTPDQRPVRVSLPIPPAAPKNPQSIRAAVDDMGQKYAERFGRSLDWLGRLTDLLLVGSDRQVLNLRPFELAADWSAPRSQVLEFFLHATEQGAFELDWQLQCPNCQVAKSSTRTLRDVTSRFHCDLCGVDYETDLAESVELRFRVHPRLRRAVDTVYCLMGPYQSRHILSQFNLLPGDVRSVDFDSLSEVRCRIVGEEKKSRNLSVPISSRGSYEWNGSWNVTSGMQNSITNSSDATITVVVETTKKDPLSVSAAHVTSLQTFRRLFGAEVLAVGATVAVKHLCFLFSDLKDSTALYSNIGDAAAFARVQKHFQYLDGLLQQYEGALVKTMGDAIMAVFSDPTNALLCAIAMQNQLEAFNRSLRFDPPVILKLGLHSGPAIAIQNDGVLDYFGSSVNYAARVQSLSGGTDIVLSEVFFRSLPDTMDLGGWKLEKFTALLKGISNEENCMRLSARVSASRLPNSAPLVRKAS
jgi:adenylate cyclase